MMEYPTQITLRAGIVLAPPFAMPSEHGGGGNAIGNEGKNTAAIDGIGNNSTAYYSGFSIDLLERLKEFARIDGVALNFALDLAPSQYGPALDLIANDCANVTSNSSDCDKFDLVVGDYYSNPDRLNRVDFTPPWLRTTISTARYIGDIATAHSQRHFDTMSQLEAAGGTACVPEGTYLLKVAMAKFPVAEFYQCPDPIDCIANLKNFTCRLYIEDELSLRYRALSDPTLEVNRDNFNTQNMVYPMRYDLDPKVSFLMRRWMYAAIANGTLDDLYRQYFAIQLCPFGKAGPNCDRPCDPKNGESNRDGKCICDSTKWTGPDCSVEVVEDVNLIPPGLKIAGYVMFSTAALVIVACAAWLLLSRDKRQVKHRQPPLLGLVLLGCLMSTSTILALAQESEGDGPVPACMASVWLYSGGFSLTFGTLLAKIWRIRKLFACAAKMQRTAVTLGDALVIVFGILAVDVAILAIWTGVDPLQWTRQVFLSDKYGEPLASHGYCWCESVNVFSAILAVLHFAILAAGAYYCYESRAIPTQFSEGKFVSLAILSNLQIFLIGLPVLVIVGFDSDSSFFVRAAIIWINNMTVVGLVFGNLIHAVQMDKGVISTRTAIKSFMNEDSSNSHGKRSEHATVSPPKKDSTTDLITAASKGDLDRVRYLLKKNAHIHGSKLNVTVRALSDVNAGDYDHRTALHLAAGEGHAQVVEELIVRGSDVNAEDRWGGRPLDDALHCGHLQCADILRQYGGKSGKCKSKALQDSVKPTGDCGNGAWMQSYGRADIDSIKNVDEDKAFDKFEDDDTIGPCPNFK